MFSIVLFSGLFLAPVPDESKSAKEAMERAQHEVLNLEQSYRDQRSRVRGNLAEKAHLVRVGDAEMDAERKTDAVRIKQLEAYFDKLKDPTLPEYADQRDELDQLRKNEQERNKKAKALRKEVIEAEEELRFLDRQHETQRKVLDLQMELAEQRWRRVHGLPQRENSLEGRLKSYELQLANLAKQVEALRRELKQTRNEP